MADDLVDPHRIRKIAETIRRGESLTPDDQAYAYDVLMTVGWLHNHEVDGKRPYDIFEIGQQINEKTNQAIQAGVRLRAESQALIEVANPSTTDRVEAVLNVARARYVGAGKIAMIAAHVQVYRAFGMTLQKAVETYVEQFEPGIAGTKTFDSRVSSLISQCTRLGRRVPERLKPQKRGRRPKGTT